MTSRSHSIKANLRRAAISGPPMTLGNAAGACVRQIVWCLLFGEPRLRRASRVRREPHGFAGCRVCPPIRLSPLRRHFVPPKVAQVLIPSKEATIRPRAKKPPLSQKSQAVCGWTFSPLALLVSSALTVSASDEPVFGTFVSNAFARTVKACNAVSLTFNFPSSFDSMPI